MDRESQARIARAIAQLQEQIRASEAMLATNRELIARLTRQIEDTAASEGQSPEQAIFTAYNLGDGLIDDDAATASLLALRIKRSEETAGEGPRGHVQQGLRSGEADRG